MRKRFISMVVEHLAQYRGGLSHMDQKQMQDILETHFENCIVSVYLIGDIINLGKGIGITLTPSEAAKIANNVEAQTLTHVVTEKDVKDHIKVWHQNNVVAKIKPLDTTNVESMLWLRYEHCDNTKVKSAILFRPAMPWDEPAAMYHTVYGKLIVVNTFGYVGKNIISEPNLQLYTGIKANGEVLLRQDFVSLQKLIMSIGSRDGNVTYSELTTCE